jgi:hypothetical protein
MKIEMPSRHTRTHILVLVMEYSLKLSLKNPGNLQARRPKYGGRLEKDLPAFDRRSAAPENGNTEDSAAAEPNPRNPNSRAG